MKKMSKGEKMIWAAMYAASFKRIMEDEHDDDEDDEGVAVKAIEEAHHAVALFRDAKKHLKVDDIVGALIMSMYNEMTK